MHAKEADIQADISSGAAHWAALETSEGEI